jgi:dCTP deaminase
MVLGKNEIVRLMEEFGPNDSEGLVITPLLDKDNIFDDDSVDLRLGCYFLLPKTLDQPFFSPDRNSSTALHVKVHVPLGHYLVVPAHQTILGATLEFIKLPYNVSGQVLTKSTVARSFIVVETAPWIHPQYRGCLTLEIANVSNTPVLLYPGRTMCQLVLMQNIMGAANTSSSGDNAKDSGASEAAPNYFGPVYPEAPKFRDPHEDLWKIGVTRVSVLKQAQLNWDGKEWNGRNEELKDDEKKQEKNKKKRSAKKARQ